MLPHRYTIFMSSSVATGFFKVAVHPALPIKGKVFILGNDIAGGIVMPVLEVFDDPELTSESDGLALCDILPSRHKAQLMKGEFDLSDSWGAIQQGDSGLCGAAAKNLVRKPGMCTSTRLGLEALQRSSHYGELVLQPSPKI